MFLSIDINRKWPMLLLIGLTVIQRKTPIQCKNLVILQAENKIGFLIA